VMHSVLFLDDQVLHFWDVHNRGKDEINVNECREWRSVSCQLIFRHPFENAVICAVLQNLSL